MLPGYSVRNVDEITLWLQRKFAWFASSVKGNSWNIKMNPPLLTGSGGESHLCFYVNGSQPKELWLLLQLSK